MRATASDPTYFPKIQRRLSWWSTRRRVFSIIVVSSGYDVLWWSRVRVYLSPWRHSAQCHGGDYLKDRSTSI